jgi:hypothetical protein
MTPARVAAASGNARKLIAIFNLLKTQCGPSAFAARDTSRHPA